MLHKILYCSLLLGMLSSCKLKVVSIRNDQGKVEERYQVMRKQKEVKHGFYKFYHLNGKVAIDRMYIRGKVDGDEKTYYDNGQLESVAIVKKGVYDGPFYYYYEDGTIKQEGEYIKNSIEGQLKTYYSSGQLKETVTMLKTMEQGPFIEYYENGNLRAKGAYKDGDQKHGVIEIYSSEGVLIRKLDCELGKCETIWEKYARP
ncbi:MAG: toxin-antitoxin system YwqK family antitoxin [Aureispira sp.]|nr:toxin-antitoxin system YwqK family antitoxin [Aureispira sp.]